MERSIRSQACGPYRGDITTYQKKTDVDRSFNRKAVLKLSWSCLSHAGKAMSRDSTQQMYRLILKNNSAAGSETYGRIRRYLLIYKERHSVLKVVRD